jgi:hypothetical protein
MTLPLHTGNQEVSNQQCIVHRNKCKFDSLHVSLYMTPHTHTGTHIHAITYVYVRARNVEINTVGEAAGNVLKKYTMRTRRNCLLVVQGTLR